MMTEQLTTIARPYAQAAFEYALDNHDLASWEMMLKQGALLVKNNLMIQLLNNPEVTKEELVELFNDLLGKLLDQEKKNFVRLLAQYERLVALPEIAELFVSMCREFEKVITVNVTSAVPMDEAIQQKFTDALTRRLKRKITLDCTVDASLLGGALIRAGDLVIDGSIRGKLNRMIEYI